MKTTLGKVAPVPSASSAAGKEPALWAPRFWDNAHQVGLQFDSETDLDAAIDWLWEAPELRDLPRVHVGRNTMIVPAAALALFRQKGFQFTVCPVVSAGDLPPEEVNRIRRG